MNDNAEEEESPSVVNAEEVNVENQIEIEEKLVNKNFHVPTTPGSVYGGSRNIMKHNIA